MVRLRRGRLTRKGGDEPGGRGDAYGNVAELWNLGRGGASQSRLLGELSAAVEEMMADEDLTEYVFGLLDESYVLVCGRDPGIISAETALAIRTVAGVGYMARRAEAERITASAETDRWKTASGFFELALREAGKVELTGSDNLARAAAWLAVNERVDPRERDQVKPSRALPGLDPDDRRRLREQTMAIAVRVGPNGVPLAPHGEVSDVTLDEFRRVWKYGLFLRSLEEFLGAHSEEH